MKKTQEWKDKISKTLKERGIKPLIRYDATGKKHKDSWRTKMKETMARKFKKIDKICPQCLKEYKVGLYHSWRKYCSRNCQNKAITKSPEWHRLKAIREVNIRRARKQSVGGEFTTTEWQELKRKYNYMCLCCKKSEPEIRLCADHIIPLSKGGINSIENIQPLCRSCNARKYVYIIDYRLGISTSFIIKDLL